jgi:hypothetical protein
MDEAPEGQPGRARLAVHIPEPIDLRLRLQKQATRTDMGVIVAEALDEKLPSVEALAAQLAGRAEAR